MSEPNLIGVWKSTDQHETRHIYVTKTDNRYAYGHTCDQRGMRSPRSRMVRVLLNGHKTGLLRYRRPDTALS